MSAWTPSANAAFPDLDYMVGAVGGSALSTDSSPNSAAPDASRVIILPNANQGSIGQGRQNIMELFCSGGTCTLVGWVHSARAGRWIQVFSQAIASQDAFVAVGVGIVGQGNNAVSNAIPDGVPFFLQLSSNTGATIFGALIH